MRCFVIFTQQVDLRLNGYLEILTTAVRKWWSYLAYRAFSRCVTSAIWVCKKQDELNLVLMQKRSFDPITLRSCWWREWKHCTSSMVRNPSPGDSYIKVTRMLVVSLWGVNCRVWSHLGCLGWKVTIFVRSGACMLSTVHKKKNTKNALTPTTQKSPLGVSLRFRHTHIGVP